jgi:hypothetical protein
MWNELLARRKSDNAGEQDRERHILQSAHIQLRHVRLLYWLTLVEVNAAALITSEVVRSYQ